MNVIMLYISNAEVTATDLCQYSKNLYVYPKDPPQIQITLMVLGITGIIAGITESWKDL